MLLDSTIVTMAVWNTNYNKTYTPNSGGTATYSHTLFDKINDHMIQMQARGLYIGGHNLPCLISQLLLFSTSPKNTQ